MSLGIPVNNLHGLKRVLKKGAADGLKPIFHERTHGPGALIHSEAEFAGSVKIRAERKDPAGQRPCFAGTTAIAF